ALAKASPSPPASASVVTLNASASTDPNNPALSPLSFAWTQTSGSPVNISNANTPVASFTAPTILAGQSNQTFGFNVRVTNSGGMSSNATVSVTVTATVQSPLANAIAGPNPANGG